jgi:signal transducing adaptor molecule
MSVQDKGGRSQWTGYSAAASSSGVGASSSNVSLGRRSSASAANQASSSSSHKPSTHVASTFHSGYVPARTPSPKPQSPEFTHTRASSVRAAAPVVPAAVAPAPEVPAASQEPTQGAIPVVTRVRALHTFEPTEPGELAFDKGDVIKVVDRGYKDWWRGQLKGRTGIFPVNYVVSTRYTYSATVTVVQHVCVYRSRCPNPLLPNLPRRPSRKLPSLRKLSMWTNC